MSLSAQRQSVENTVCLLRKNTVCCASQRLFQSLSAVLPERPPLSHAPSHAPPRTRPLARASSHAPPRTRPLAHIAPCAPPRALLGDLGHGGAVPQARRRLWRGGGEALGPLGVSRGEGAGGGAGGRRGAGAGAVSAAGDLLEPEEAALDAEHPVERGPAEEEDKRRLRSLADCSPPAAGVNGAPPVGVPDLPSKRDE
eukprot:718495-Rhodomonas_salina.1